MITTFLSQKVSPSVSARSWFPSDGYPTSSMEGARHISLATLDFLSGALNGVYQK